VPFILVLAADGHAVDAFEGEQDEATLADALASAR
jgi:thioredoxin-like negative regulator of GroEL